MLLKTWFNRLFKKSTPVTAGKSRTMSGCIGMPADQAPFKPQDVIEFLLRINSPLLPWFDAYKHAHIHQPNSWSEAFTERPNGKLFAIFPEGSVLALFSARRIKEEKLLSNLEKQFRRQYHKPLMRDMPGDGSDFYDVGWLIQVSPDKTRADLETPASAPNSLERLIKSIPSRAVPKEGTDFRVRIISLSDYEAIRARRFDPHLGWGIFAKGSIQDFLIQESKKAGLSSASAVTPESETSYVADSESEPDYIPEPQPEPWWHFWRRDSECECEHEAESSAECNNDAGRD